MYYLYHIKGVKWGCSKTLVKRLKAQGYSLTDAYEIIEISDLDEAADMEKELNIRDGYRWRDDQDYRVILNAGKQTYKNKERVWNGRLFTKEECSLGAYIAGKYPTEKARNARRNNMNKLNEYKTCPHCNIYARGLGYNRYHGDKCKLNPNHQN
jgi:hypothetical protein